MSMALAPIPSNIALLAVPPLFGHLFNYGLFGILTAQVYVYSLSFPADPKHLKIFIYGLFMVECVQVALDSTHMLWFDIPIMSGLISASVQCFFAWRIYVLSKSLYLGAFIFLVALMQGAGAMATGIMVYTLSLTDSAIQAITTAPCTVWLAGSAACDVTIAGCMSYFLSRGKRGSGIDALLSRLIRLTVETGTLTASVACVDLILFLAFKDNNLHFAPALTLSKLYSNSLMMLFNNRTQMRNLRGGIQTTGGRLWLSTGGDGEIETGQGGIADAASHAAPQEFALRKLPPLVSRAHVTIDVFDNLSHQHSDMRKASAAP